MQSNNKPIGAGQVTSEKSEAPGWQAKGSKKDRDTDQRDSATDRFTGGDIHLDRMRGPNGTTFLVRRKASPSTEVVVRRLAVAAITADVLAAVKGGAR